MSGGASVIEILIYAAVALFLLFRLRSVLGRRTGEEQQRRNPFDNPISSLNRLRTEPTDRSGPAAPLGIEHDSDIPLSLEARIGRLHAADPNFDEKHFVAGARKAFEMIVQAFAIGDLATLRPLLSSQLYGEFGRIISERRERGELGPVQFEGPISAEIIDARTAPRELRVEVRITSRQIYAGETVAPEEDTVDLWTFVRDPSQRDPNWQLTQTAIEA